MTGRVIILSVSWTSKESACFEPCDLSGTKTRLPVILPSTESHLKKLLLFSATCSLTPLMIPTIRWKNAVSSSSVSRKTGRSFASLVRESRLAEKESYMKKAGTEKEEDELRPEYDLSKLKGRVRGKYAERYRAGTNLVLLEPDVATAFPDAKTVNEALRLLIKVAQKQTPPQR